MLVPNSQVGELDAQADSEFRRKPAALSDHYVVMVKPARANRGTDTCFVHLASYIVIRFGDLRLQGDVTETHDQRS
jgi:hypothetical protein